MKIKSLFFLALLCPACTAVPQLSEHNIDRVIKAMTVEEKVHLLVGGGQKDVVDSASAAILSERKASVQGAAGFTYPIPRLGIPAIVLADGPAGLRIDPVREGSNGTFYCTGFPIGTLLAASWDPALVEQMCAAMGDEVKQYGVDVLLAPGINIHRNPLCGRNFEYFSEDPLLSGKIAAGYVRGIQSQGVGTSVKHFAVNNSELNRKSCDSRVSARAARELYLKNFEIAIRESSPWTVMSSYNYLNGRYTSEDPALLKGILRSDWGYDALVMSDWGGGYDASAQIAASNDLIEAGSDGRYRDIMEAIEDGSLKMEDVDASVRRILEFIVKCPSFKGYTPTNAPDLKAHALVSRKAATEGMVLLKNDSALPLAKGTCVAIFGTNSYKLAAGGTGAGDVHKAYTISLDEGIRQSSLNIETSTDSLYRAFLATEGAKIDSINAERNQWYCSIPYPELEGTDALYTDAAKSADAAIITIVRQSGEGRDRAVKDDFTLRDDEIGLIRTVTEAFHERDKKVTVILNVSGAMETASWKDTPDAILMAWQPGQEAGAAIADVLTGTVNPSGRLPMSLPLSYSDVPSQNFPQVELPDQTNGSYYHYKGGRRFYDIKDADWIDYTEDIYVGYRYYTTFGKAVSYPFGYGLSYTEFAYSDLKVKPSKDGWDIAVKVTNTGEAAGKEVVQIYSECTEGDNPRFELRAFGKSSLLSPGQEEIVRMHIAKGDIAHFDEASSSWTATKGSYTIRASKDADNHILKGTITLEKDYVKKVCEALSPVRLTAPDGRQSDISTDSAAFLSSELYIDSSSKRLRH